MLQVGSKFQLKGAGPRGTVYTVTGLNEDGTVTATYQSFIGLGQYQKRETTAIELEACVECK